MPIVLTLLDGVRWGEETVVGDRPAALLASLVAAGRAVSADRLIEEVWDADVPANPAKALQVVVSRVRASCGAEAVLREGEGYRLGLGRDQVDAWVLADLVAEAAVLFDTDPLRAGELAEQALALPVAAADESAAGELRRLADGRRRRARVLAARARARRGEFGAALPELERARAEDGTDEALFADLLRALAAVRGPAVALQAYEDHRAAIAERLGTDPGPELRRLHGELLALDSPVREGIRYEANALLGRDRDVQRLHALLGSSRVVSILGPGGLGKTRLAHVLGREAAQPVVHVVELVGVTVADDLIGEVGSVLGVRDSVSGRRALTPEQRADVRARIAQHLDVSPALLILDNCEHIVAAVADLVAFLVATTRELRVLTTTRAPLAIAAEQVYPLGELDTVDAVELFRRRAVAARPDVRVDDDEVAGIVRRLDGLPLAIELAAAKVRVMAVADIARRLENRFALLRGGDRSAPDRHQTLLAVIDWSWNLLAEPERRALRWLSVFGDGFGLDAAEAVLGPDALQAVQDLADQSLVSVLDGDGGTRYRMLETVREFGRMQLIDAGEDGDARQAQRDWALAFCARWSDTLFGPGQFDSVDAFRAEENNLADVLRQALAEPDPVGVVRILAGLGTFWTILGDHIRVFVLAEAVVDALDGWTPAPADADAARVAVAITVNNAVIAGDLAAEKLRAHLRAIGPDSADPRIAAMVTIMQAYEPHTGSAFLDHLRTLAVSPDRHLAMSASQWISYVLENEGDPEGALAAARIALALADPADGPWVGAILSTQVAQFAMQLGLRDDARAHARAALPVLQRLGARDDTLQLRGLLVLFAVSTGDLDAAQRELVLLEAAADGDTVFGGRLVMELARSELFLARGEIEAGLASYDGAVAKVRTLRFPGVPHSGLEPWILFGESTALTAHAEFGPEQDPAGRALYEEALARVGRVLDPDFPYLDYPVCGLALFGLGAWGLRRDALAPDAAVRLLVLADRFAYNRSVPSMAWSRIVVVAEVKAPGLVAAIEAEYGGRRGPDLLEEARAFVATL